jgi:hypothetical protein
MCHLACHAFARGIATTVVFPGQRAGGEQRQETGTPNSSGRRAVFMQDRASGLVHTQEGNHGIGTFKNNPKRHDLLNNSMFNMVWHPVFRLSFMFKLPWHQCP